MLKLGSIAPVVALSRPRPACAVPLSQLNAPATYSQLPSSARSRTVPPSERPTQLSMIAPVDGLSATRFFRETPLTFLKAPPTISVPPGPARSVLTAPSSTGRKVVDMVPVVRSYAKR